MTQQSQPNFSSPTIPIVLTIASSDNSGSTDIQAEIKVMSATGSFACSVITSINSLKQLLIPLADILYPNLLESAVLTGKSIPEPETEMNNMAGHTYVC